MNIFTVTAKKDSQACAEIKVLAQEHRQHIWNQTTLTGVSSSGMRRLAAFFRAYAGCRITVNAGRHNPRLIGYEAISHE